MSAEIEYLNEENGRLRRQINTLEFALRKAEAKLTALEKQEPVVWRREWEGDVSDLDSWLYIEDEADKDELPWQSLYPAAGAAQPAADDDALFTKCYQAMALAMGVLDADLGHGKILSELADARIALERRSNAKAAQPVSAAVPDVREAVNRFLSWKLPKDFSPDCGISFDGRGKDAMGYEKSWPIGTNLFTAEQARQMFEYVLVSATPLTLEEAYARESATHSPHNGTSRSWFAAGWESAHNIKEQP